MNNRILIVAGVVALVVLGGLGFYFYGFTGKENAVSVGSTEQASIVSAEKVPSTQLKQYTDSSGFSFSYPVDLELQKAETTDNSTYADLTIASPEVDGSFVIKVTDTTFTTLESWVKSNKEAIKTKDTKLGTLKAVEISSGNKTTLAAIDQGILFLVTVSHPEQAAYWQNVYKTVISSFAFAAPQAAATTSGGSQAADSGVDLEGEEVIE